MPRNFHNRPKKLNSFFLAHHREAVIVFSTVLILLVCLLFPVARAGEMFWVNIFLFLVFPWMITRFLLKGKVREFGMAAGNVKQGLLFGGIFILIFLLLNYFLVFRTHFQAQLKVFPPSIFSFWIFLWYQLLVSLPSHFSWEFFFRGFLQLGLEKKIGKYAIFIQAVAQTLLYARSSWLAIFLIGSSALVAGLVVHKTRSLYYSFAAMWLISFSMDLMIIKYIHIGIK